MLIEALRARLQGRTPGAAVEASLRAAAVLIPLVSEPDDHRLLLTRRAASLRRQPNEISFPGGVIDAGDPSPLAAALRESREEVGLESSAVDILGQMDEMVTRTGFRVTPFVGAVAGPYPFKPNHEVSELILAPLRKLRAKDALRVETRKLGSGVEIPVYHYLYGGYDIWGITGRLLKELLSLLPRDD